MFIALKGISFQNLFYEEQGQVVQRIVSLTSSLVVKILTVLVSTISNSQFFFSWTIVSSFSNY